MNVRWYKYLRKLVYDFFRVFLLENHSYRRERSTFNGKWERTQRLEIMTHVEWIREWDREKKKEYI